MTENKHIDLLKTSDYIDVNVDCSEVAPSVLVTKVYDDFDLSKTSDYINVNVDWSEVAPSVLVTKVQGPKQAF